MTDTELESPKPRRPHRRVRPTEPVSAETHPNGTPDALATMLARLEALEQLQMRTVPQAPPPQPVARVPSPEALTPFQRELQAQTRPTPKEIPSDPGYNFPLRWYCRPDGDIVQLQGDPQNRAMYQDLGFVLLNAEQVARWEGGERDIVVAQQQERAGLITAVRAFATRTPGYVLAPDMPYTDVAFSDMSMDELREFAHEIEQEKGVKIRAPKRKPEADRKASSDSRASGIEAGSMDPRMAALLDGSRNTRMPVIDGNRSIEAQAGRPMNFTTR